MKKPSTITDLILWMRREGIAWRTLSVGGVTIEGSDTRLEQLDAKPATVTGDRVSYRDRYGASLLSGAAESPGMTSVVEELDD